MAQIRSFNYLDDDSTWDFNIRQLGIISPGIYRGFDFVPGSTMELVLGHSLTGYRYTNRNGTEMGPFSGVIVSRQGVTIMEDEPISVIVEANPLPYPRIDTVVCSHRYTELEGGEQATYAVVKGNPAQNPVAPGVLNPLTDIQIGTLYIPSGTVATNGEGVYWRRSPTPFIAEDDSRLPIVFSRYGNIGVVETENHGRKSYDVFLQNTEIDSSDVAPDANSLIRTGFYSLHEGINLPTSDEWHYVEVHSHDHSPGTEYISQIAHTMTQERHLSFRRACINGKWLKWKRLNGVNEEVKNDANFNDYYLDPIIVRIGGVSSNGPKEETNNSWILQVVPASDLSYQIAVEANSTTPNVWIRTYSPYFNDGSGGFTAWRRMDSAKVASDLAAYRLANDTRVKNLEDGKQNMLPKGVVMEYAGPLVNEANEPIFDSTGKGIWGDMKGWALCNGQNQTVDKRGRFTVGFDPASASFVDDSSYSHTLPNGQGWTFIDGFLNYGKIGNKGGKATVGLIEPQMPNHTHGIPVSLSNGTSPGSYIGVGDGNGQLSEKSTNATGMGDNHENRPPYIVMGYIQKIV